MGGRHRMLRMLRRRRSGQRRRFSRRWQRYSRPLRRSWGQLRTSIAWGLMSGMQADRQQPPLP